MQSLEMNEILLVFPSLKAALDLLAEYSCPEHDVILYDRLNLLGKNEELKYSIEKEKEGVISNKRKAKYLYNELIKFRDLIERLGLKFLRDHDEAGALNLKWEDALESVHDLASSFNASPIPDDAEESFIESEIRRIASIVKKAYISLFMNVTANDDLILACMEKVEDEIKDIGETTNSYAMGLRSVKLCFQRLMTFSDVWETSDAKSSNKKRKNH